MNCGFLFLLDKGVGGQYGGALQAAIYNRIRAMVKVMIKRGANTECSLKFALKKLKQLHEDIIRLLLGNGADINTRETKYGSILQMATHIVSFEFVRFLVDNGAGVNNYSGQYGSALQVAAYREVKEGRSDIFYFLLVRGASINAPASPKCGFAIQGVASWKEDLDEGRDDLVRLLLERGAAINGLPQCTSHTSVLESYVIRKDEDMIEYLVSRGARLRDQGSVDPTARRYWNNRESLKKMKQLYCEMIDQKRKTSE
ncbi:ankyrin repeat-containing domain protein [Pyronema domesticum]|nr:ankyrin repeat-containing domain protein [Pyronema domesticum]